MTLEAGLKQRKRQPFFYASVLVVFFGLIYMFVIPLCEAPDEQAHFARAYGITEGQFVLKNQPRELLEFVKKCMKRHESSYEFLANILNNDKSRFENLAFNTALYSPFPYVFYSAIIRIVSSVTKSENNFKLYFYFARAVSLALFIGVVLWLCAYAYDLKWIVFWVFTNPMALAQASTINLDIVIFCASVLILLSSFCVEKKGSIFLIIMAGFFLMLSKPVYTPILVLPLVTIFIKDIEKKYAKLWGLVIAYAAMLLTGVIWGVVSQKYGIFDRYIEVSDSVTSSPRDHLIHVLTSPIDFLKIIFTTLAQNGSQIYHQFVGTLGWLDVPVSAWVTVLWGIFAVIILFSVDTGELNFTKKQARYLGLVFILTALLCFGLVMLSGYMLWTPLSARTIAMQGRYFHVVVATLFLGLALIRPEFKINYKTGNLTEWSVVAACLVIHASTLHTLLDTFWF